MVYTIEELKQKITPIAHKHGLRAVYIFGSYARNEATADSDIDVLIDREGSCIRSLFDMGGLHNELCESIGKEVDLVTIQALAQDSTKERTPWFIDNIMKERVAIYEKQ